MLLAPLKKQTDIANRRSELSRELLQSWAHSNERSPCESVGGEP